MSDHILRHPTTHMQSSGGLLTRWLPTNRCMTIATHSSPYSKVPMNVLDLLISDIKLIVCRYLHQHRYRSVIRQYNEQIKLHWRDKRDRFVQACGHFLLNYRELTGDRDRFVYSFEGEERLYMLSPNYYHTIVWWPIPIEIRTHKAVAMGIGQQTEQ